MKVTLIDYTGAGNERPANYAASLLIFAKSTRLTMAPGLLYDISSWPMEKKLEELAYIANTIPSSWEFCHYTFLIEGVTRAFTHQLVRSRTFSFAQQTMRVLNVSQGEGRGWTYGSGPTINKDLGTEQLYEAQMETIDHCYKMMIEKGAAVEDARGILPTNILTNIMMSGNLRSFCELVTKRSSPRTQGEYRSVLDAMKQEIMKAHPFTSLFFERTFEKSAAELDEWIKNSNEPNKAHLHKLVDQLRSKQ